MPVALRRLCVFCGSSEGVRPAYRAAAEALGAELCARGVGLVYGGGASGLMGALAERVMAGGGEVTGVIPDGLFRREASREAVTTLHRTASMHERKALMYDLADAFVALPGGLGTLDELAECATWAQIGLHAKPIGVLDVEGFFAPLLGWLGHAAGEGFIAVENLARVLVERDPADLLDRLALHAGGGARTERI